MGRIVHFKIIFGHHCMCVCKSKAQKNTASPISEIIRWDSHIGHVRPSSSWNAITYVIKAGHLHVRCGSDWSEIRIWNVLYERIRIMGPCTHSIGNIPLCVCNTCIVCILFSWLLTAAALHFGPTIFLFSLVICWCCWSITSSVCSFT